MEGDDLGPLTAEEEEVARELEDFLRRHNLIGKGGLAITRDLVDGLTPRILQVVNERINRPPLDVKPDDAL